MILVATALLNLVYSCEMAGKIVGTGTGINAAKKLLRLEFKPPETVPVFCSLKSVTKSYSSPMGLTEVVPSGYTTVALLVNFQEFFPYASHWYLYSTPLIG